MQRVGPTFRLRPKQTLFVGSGSDELLYSGGFGGGKTLMVCIKAVMRATHPRAVEVLTRAKLDDVKDTILPTLFEGAGDTPPVLAPGSYTWNKAERWIRLVTGGTIRYLGLGDRRRNELDRMKFRGQNVTGLGIDQAEEISQRQYLNALGRIRSSGANITRQVYMSANPSSPSHWLAERFSIMPGHSPETTASIRRIVKNPDGSESDRMAVLTCPMDIADILPPDYMARLASYTGTMRARYVLGRWAGSEGVVYDNFDRSKHVRRINGEWDRLLIGVDDGTTNPCAILLVGVDGDGRVHVLREAYRRGMLTSEKVAVVKSMGPVDAVIVDPAAGGLKAELRAVGLPVHDGNNAVLTGIQGVRQALEARADGRPGLTIDDSCTHTIIEAESYEWDENAAKEKPIKVNDHAMDALRYVVMHVGSPPPVVFDTGSLVKVEKAAAAAPDVLVGVLTHTHAAGREQDMSIADGRVRDIGFEEESGGPLTLWASLTRGRPPHEEPHCLFAVAGDGGAPGVVVVADAWRREIVAQWSKVCHPERLARVVAMLSLWFECDGVPASIGYLGNTPGKVLGQNLGRLHTGGDEWEPTPREFAEAVGVLRAAWDAGSLVERDPSVFGVARQYLYVGDTMMHASLVGVPERRGSHADTLMARVGLWRMLAGITPGELAEREAPIGSPEYRRRQRLAQEDAKKQLAFG